MEKKYLSVAAASKYCGVSKRLLYKIIASRQIRSYRICTKIVLAMEDLEEFIEESDRDPIDWAERAKGFLE